MAENKKILELPELGLLHGLIGLPVQDPDTGITYHVKLATLLPENVIASIAWEPGLAYPEDAIVSYLDALYLSQVDDNESVPGVDANWLQVNGSLSAGIPMYAAGVFTAAEVSVYKLINSDLRLVRLASATRPYNSTDFDAELTAGDWEVVSGATMIKDISTTTEDLFLDFKLNADMIFRASPSFTVSKIVTYLNAAKGRTFELTVIIDDLAATILFPVGTISEDANWNNVTRIWTPPQTGKFKFTGVNDGVNWYLERVQGFFI